MLYTSRRRVRPGDIVLAWSPDGTLAESDWRLHPGDSNAIFTLAAVPFAGRGRTWWDGAYVGAVRIPDLCPDGAATLMNGGEAADLVVSRAKDRHMRPHIADGYVQYQPTSDGMLTGHVGGPDGGTELFHWPDDRVAENVTLLNVWLRNRILTGGRLPGLFATGCKFEHCSLRSLVGPALFYRCHFIGLAPPLYPEVQVTGGGVAFVDCTWQDTGNGIAFQTTYGPIAGSLVTGAVLRGLNLTRNGSDGIAVEGPHEFSRNLILHTRYEGEGHIFNLWKIAGTRNTFREYLGRGGMGVQTVPPDDNPDGLKDNCFCGGELVGTTQVSKSGELELSPAAIMQYWDRPAWAPGAEPEKTLWVDRSLRGNLW
jgi:hypothetical protein